MILRELRRIYAIPSEADSLQIASYFLTYIMDAFLRFRYDRPGGGRDRLTEMGNNEVLDAVSSGDAALGVILHAVEKSEKFLRAAEKKGLEIHPLFGPMEMCAIMIPSHPLADKESITIEEFRSYPVVFYDDESSMIYLLEHLKRPKDPPYLQVSDRGHFIDALNTGIYHSCIFMPMKGPHPLYRVAPIRDASFVVQIDYVLKKNRQLNAREEAFLQFLRSTVDVREDITL